MAGDVGPLYAAWRVDVAALSPAGRAVLARAVGEPLPPDAPAATLPDGTLNPAAVVALDEVQMVARELARRAVDGAVVDLSIPAALADAGGSTAGIRALALQSTFQDAAAAHLTDLYLEASGLSAADARTLANLEKPEDVGGLFDYDRLTVGDRREMSSLRRTLAAALRLLTHEASRGVSPAVLEVAGRVDETPDGVVMDLEDGGPPVVLTLADVAAARAVVARHLGPDAPESAQGRRALPFTGQWVTGPQTELPTAAHAAARFAALMAQGQVAADEWPALLEGRRTRADGSRVPLLGEFLEARSRLQRRNWQLLRPVIVSVLDARARYDAERRAAEAEAERDALAQQLEEERAKRRRPALRQGLGWLRASMQRPEHVGNARKRGQLAGRLTPEEAEARRLFKYEPLGWAERLVVHALAALAREHKLLDAHPTALQVRPHADTPAPRVRLTFPGVAELARIAGYEPDASGRIPKEIRAVIENALRDLTTRPRWVAEPVLVPAPRHGRAKRGNGRPGLVEDLRVTQTLWVEATATVLTRHTELLLHPVAFASHLASYVPVGNLAARYDAAKRAIGRRQMRDEWAAADDYLRYLAAVKLKDRRATAERAGATPEEAAAMVTAGNLVVRADVADKTLREALGIARLTRDRGESVTRERVADALAFASAMGTLRAYRLDEDATAPTWRLELAHPGVQLGTTDPAQGVLFGPGTPEGGVL